MANTSIGRQGELARTQTSTKSLVAHNIEPSICAIVVVSCDWPRYTHPTCGYPDTTCRHTGVTSTITPCLKLSPSEVEDRTGKIPDASDFQGCGRGQDQAPFHECDPPVQRVSKPEAATIRPHADFDSQL